MAHASFELQTALFALLAADGPLTALLGGPAIHDRAPPDAAFPYVTFGPAGGDDFSTQTGAGLEHRVVLDIWSRDNGRGEVLAIAEAIGTAIAGATVALPGHALVDLLHVATDIGLDEDGETFHGVLRYRAVTEPSG
jgi:hypothetical protein